jgi:hypothetical protein
MFRSQTDHHQGGTILLLNLVTKFYFIDVAACLQVTIKMNLVGNEFDKLNHMYYLIWSSGNIVIGNSSDNTYDLI